MIARFQAMEIDALLQCQPSLDVASSDLSTLASMVRYLFEPAIYALNTLSSQHSTPPPAPERHAPRTFHTRAWLHDGDIS